MFAQSLQVVTRFGLSEAGEYGEDADEFEAVRIRIQEWAVQLRGTSPSA